MSVASNDTTMTSGTTATTTTSHSPTAPSRTGSSSGGTGNIFASMDTVGAAPSGTSRESMPAPGLITGQLSPVSTKPRPSPAAASSTGLTRSATSRPALGGRSMAPELADTYKNALRSTPRATNSTKLTDDDADSDEDLTRYFAEMAAKRDACKAAGVRFSERSRKLLEDTDRLLSAIPSYSGHHDLMTTSLSGRSARDKSRSTSPAIRIEGGRSRDEREWDRDPGGEVMSASTSRFLMHTPRFPRIDFDDWLEEDIEAKKPAWRQLQDNIKTTFNKPRRTVERNRELNDCQEQVLNRRKVRVQRSESMFSMRPDSESFIPRAPSWFASGAMQPRGLKESFASTPGSGLYAAPAVGSTQGLESSHSTRYNKLVDEMELRLLKSSILPESMKGVTRRDFRNAPAPSAGSVAEAMADETDMALHVMPRPFYSRPTKADPDYFDFDLQHSVNMYKRPEGIYTPRGPQPWETKLLSEYRGKGDAPISGHMFTRPTDYRNTASSYLSAALRTPSFWEHRFASIGSQVRESNPVSMMSIERNRPTPSRFTEYRDPDFEDYEDPKELVENL